MVAWTGIEQFYVGRFEPPPPADEPEDFVVCANAFAYFFTVFHLFCLFAFTKLSWFEK